MPAEKEKKGGFTQTEWKAIAEWIIAEKERRALDPRRKAKEEIWDEVDRQIEMDPIPNVVPPGSGTKQNWLPETELPLQATALEVNAADARRLKFPRGQEWFSVSANLSDEYLKRWDANRERYAIIGSQPVGMKLDQETANTLVKVTLDHYHRLFDMRSMVDLWDTECIKYGTGIMRIKKVRLDKFFNDFRGTYAKDVQGPAVVPCSIRNVYLDDTPFAVMHEGITMSPGHIRCFYKHYKDVQNAIKEGGPDRGWRTEVIKRLEPESGKDEKDMHLELIEFEGDLVVPHPNRKNPIFLPASCVTVVSGKNQREVVRFKTNDYPFSSYIIGYWQRDDLKTPYGTSPLVKGQTLHEAAVEALNTTMIGAALAARPPGFYDRHDPNFAAKGGPLIYPGAMSPTDSPDAIEFMDPPDVQKLAMVYEMLRKQYEDLTAVNDPRRGGSMRSHTTASASNAEQVRSIARVEDFVAGQEGGPMTTLLYREFEIIKDCLKKPTSIPVDAGGIDGWVRIQGSDLADDVAFRVHGSAGVLDERQKFENFMAGTNASLQLIGLALQLGVQVPIDFNAMIAETYRRAGVNNAGTFIGASASGSSGPPAGTQAGPAISPDIAGIPTNTLTDVSKATGGY